MVDHIDATTTVVVSEVSIKRLLETYYRDKFNVPRNYDVTAIKSDAVWQVNITQRETHESDTPRFQTAESE